MAPVGKKTAVPMKEAPTKNENLHCPRGDSVLLLFYSERRGPKVALLQ